MICTSLEYFHCILLYTSTPFQREILDFLLHYIYLTDIVTGYTVDKVLQLSSLLLMQYDDFQTVVLYAHFNICCITTDAFNYFCN